MNIRYILTVLDSFMCVNFFHISTLTHDSEGDRVHPPSTHSTYT